MGNPLIYLLKMSDMTKQYIVRNSSNKVDTILVAGMAGTICDGAIVS
jgi:cobalamin biosynthesis protein CbiD